MRAQITFEQSKFRELEAVLENERRGAHGNQKTFIDLEKANRDLQSEADR